MCLRQLGLFGLGGGPLNGSAPSIPKTSPKVHESLCFLCFLLFTSA